MQEITDHSVIVSGRHNEEIPADSVVLAIGRVSNTALRMPLAAEGVDVRVSAMQSSRRWQARQSEKAICWAVTCKLIEHIWRRL